MSDENLNTTTNSSHGWNDKFKLMTLMASGITHIFKNRRPIITSVMDSASLNISLAIKEIEIWQFDHEQRFVTLEQFRRKLNFLETHTTTIILPRSLSNLHFEYPYPITFEDASICKDQINTLLIRTRIPSKTIKTAITDLDRYDLLPNFQVPDYHRFS